MPTPVMTISDLTENINVTQNENKYHPRFHLKNLPKLAEHVLHQLFNVDVFT